MCSDTNCRTTLTSAVNQTRQNTLASLLTACPPTTHSPTLLEKFARGYQFDVRGVEKAYVSRVRERAQVWVWVRVRERVQVWVWVRVWVCI